MLLLTQQLSAVRKQFLLNLSPITLSTAAKSIRCSRVFPREGTRWTIGFLCDRGRETDSTTDSTSSKMLRSRPLKLYKRDVPHARYRGTDFSRIFLPSLHPPSTPFISLLENFHDVPDKARAKSTMKSSSEKASHKLGKILFTFPLRAKTMTIKAKSPFIRKLLSPSCHCSNRI